MARADSESPLSSMGDTEIDDTIMEDHDRDRDEPPAKRLKVVASTAASTASSVIIPRDDSPPPQKHKPDRHDRNKKARASTAAKSAAAAAAEEDPLAGYSDVSSDTSGSVPSSPQHHFGGLTGASATSMMMAGVTAATLSSGMNRFDIEEDIHEQVTVCLWDGCPAGDLVNMDELVKHIHGVHLPELQQTGVYTCEWMGCSRKGKKHASGYALKAHMRSHTREKPFYCYLPECDRSFTRSDALAKHMRTVHETEALRPSDPVPKSMQPGGGQPGPNYASAPPLATPSGPNNGAVQLGTPAPTGTAGGKRLKIVLKTPSSHSAVASTAADDMLTDDDHHNLRGHGVEEDWHLTPLVPDAGFSTKELDLAARDLEKLYRLCRAQLHWGSEAGETLRQQCAKLEEKYWKEWREKEALLTQVERGEEVYEVERAKRERFEEEDRRVRMAEEEERERVRGVERERREEELRVQRVREGERRRERDRERRERERVEKERKDGDGDVVMGGGEGGKKSAESDKTHPKDESDQDTPALDTPIPPPSPLYPKQHPKTHHRSASPAATSPRERSGTPPANNDTSLAKISPSVLFPIPSSPVAAGRTRSDKARSEHDGDGDGDRNVV